METSPTVPTPPPTPTNREQCTQVCIDAIKLGADAGLEKIILGVSRSLLGILLQGQRMNTPFPMFSAKVLDEAGAEATISAVMFCDPSLPGVAAYSMSWPTAPLFPVTLTPPAEGAK